MKRARKKTTARPSIHEQALRDAAAVVRYNELHARLSRLEYATALTVMLPPTERDMLEWLCERRGYIEKADMVLDLIRRADVEEQRKAKREAKSG